MTQTRRAAATAVLLAWALVGCSPEQEDPAPPAPSAATREEAGATETTTPAPPPETPPPLPPEAQAADIHGAAAFIRHYFDIVNYAYRTGDTAAIAPLRQDDCGACLSIERGITRGYSNGGSITGGIITLTDVVVTPGDMSGLVEASIVGLQSTANILDAEGQRVETIDAQGELLVGVNLERTPSGWVLSQWGTL